ncbi:MAG: molybdopterin-synthase adenylyltransferase MoeB [Gammaproteobacteria bacterium]|nr:MAG: molybdopterin-synthase adenylyltransferase MoeB [Gammaproteobacteria bacterium]
MNDNTLTPAQQERYSRHMLLPQIGQAGQARLLQSRALIIGLGGLGAPVAMYLAAAGVGRLILSDFDQVELSNLQRQVIHATEDVGRLKVDSASDTLQALNPDCQVETLAHALDSDELLRWVAAADVVLDASDNFETRFEINAACVKTGTPLVSGAAVRMEGQVGVYCAPGQDTPCYRCLYPEAASESGEPCSQVGVLAPLLGIIGSVQAVEAVKLLLGIGESLCGRLVLVDALTMEIRTVALRRDPKCPVCGGN